MKKRVVIVGGGFGGLYAAKAFRRKKDFEVVLVDRRNFHLFQPLLYQVATGGISPGDIAAPIRSVLSSQRNATVLQAYVTDIDVDNKTISFEDGTETSYDALIISTGVRQHYFGNEEWEKDAPGLKSIEEALEIRRRVFVAFERAEREDDYEKRKALMQFAIVGAGPTGCELAGALGELAHTTLKNDFRSIDPSDVKIALIEGGPRVLAGFDPKSSAKAEKGLKRLGVEILTDTFVTDIDGEDLTLKKGDEESKLRAGTVLWAAGIRGSRLALVLKEKAGAELDRVGRVKVRKNLSVAEEYPDVFVIGDLAHFDDDGEPLPGVAQVAMQQGTFVAKQLRNRAKGKDDGEFSYFDRGSLAVIGRNRAVAEVGPMKFSGIFAWLIWVFVHIAYLIEYDNRILVLTQWAINYVTRKRGARLITDTKPKPEVTD